MQALSPSELQISDDNLPTTASCKATDDTDRTCEYTTECCPPGEDDDFVVTCNPDNNLCEQGPAVLSFEPFCLAWSKPDSTSTTIDTFAFAPLLPWPPIELVPKLIKVAPFCPIGGGCSLCELVLGYPISDFNIGPVRFKLTIQFDGVAVSWAATGKLAYGTNSATSGDNAPQVSAIKIERPSLLNLSHTSFVYRYGMVLLINPYQLLMESIFGSDLGSISLIWPLGLQKGTNVVL